MDRQVTNISQNNELSKEQLEFFKDSKVRSKSGKLLKAWHGSSDNFTEFNAPINWFSLDYNYACSYALGRGTCNAFYLNCSKIFLYGDSNGPVFKPFPMTPPLQLSEVTLALAKKLNIPETEMNLIAKKAGQDADPEHNGYKTKIFNLLRRTEIATYIKAKGYDAIYTVEFDKAAGKKVQCFGVFDPAKIKAVSNTKPTNSKNFNENFIINEDTRTALLNKSRSVGGYKDTSRGKNRFERKKFSKISSSVREYNQINMNNLFKSDLLQVSIPVVGETDNYTVSVKMDGVIAEIQKNIKNNHNKFEFRTVLQALTKVFNTTNIYVKCTCADYKYNYAHWNIINNVSIDDTAHDPGPGKGIKNPHDEKGRGCKHVLLVLDNGDWLMKVASVINNYVHYAEKNLAKPFLNIIFPKLYGVDAEHAVEEGLIDTDKYLKTPTGFIDAINEYGKNATSKKPAEDEKEEE